MQHGPHKNGFLKNICKNNTSTNGSNNSLQWFYPRYSGFTHLYFCPVAALSPVKCWKLSGTPATGEKPKNLKGSPNLNPNNNMLWSSFTYFKFTCKEEYNLLSK